MEKQAQRRLYPTLVASVVAEVTELARRERRDPANVCGILVEWALLRLRNTKDHAAMSLSSMIADLGEAEQARAGGIRAGLQSQGERPEKP